MNSFKICDDLFYVGVLNPNLRVFDIVMRTDYGTTYNAYLLKGKEKTALVEASHLGFSEYFLDNIKSVAEVDKIDYLIMNHNEPDHSGSIVKLVEKYPDITVIVSQAGSIYLKNITNLTDLNVKVVKDGETLNLGGRELQFISAPFLHWPDSMFTWVPDMKVLFTCDFFGAHYCEPQIMDTRIAYPNAYRTALKGYFDAIFGPFKPYVLKGLDKIKNLDLEYVCASHGPVLTKNGLIDEVKARYLEWSTPIPKDHKTIPVFYCSAYGNTELLAKAIAVGVKEALPEADVPLYNVIEHSMEEMSAALNGSDGFLIGSPTLNKDALPPIWILLAHADAVNIAKRPAALFGSYGWSGEAVGNLSDRLKGLKVKLFEKNFRVVFVPTEEDLNSAKEFGKEFAATI